MHGTSSPFPSSLEAQNFLRQSQRKNLQSPVDSEAEFQLEPSSSGEALELLLGAGLDRVQAATEPPGWNGINHRARGPLLKVAAGIRDPPRDRQRNKAATSQLRVASSSVQCWRHWLSSERDWTPSQQGSRAETPRVRRLAGRHKRRSPAETGNMGAFSW